MAPVAPDPTLYPEPVDDEPKKKKKSKRDKSDAGRDEGDPEGDPTHAGNGDGDEADVDGKADKPGKKGKSDRLEFGGRVYVRDTLSGVDVGTDTTWLEDRSIDSARAFLVYRPNKRLRMDLEVDFAGAQPELKDTFIRYKPVPFLAVTAGRFKRPVSFIGLASTWDLPRIDRGLLSDLRIDERRLLFAGGRGDGVSLAFELPGAMEPVLTFTVHESDLASDLGLPVSDVNQDLLARFEVEPTPGLHVAVAGGWMGTLGRQAAADSYRHRAFGSLEGFLDLEPLRVWLEAMAGANATTYVNGAQTGQFIAAQALVAPRLELAGPLKMIEPYAALSWYEPSTDQAGDRLTEVTGGAALWITGKLRLQLEGGRRLAQDSAAASSDATIVRLQLGVAFKSETELK